MPQLIIYLLIALIFSFFCSIAEAVLLSVRPAYVNALKRREMRGATALGTLRDNLDRPLAAILSLNTVAHTAGAVGVGAQAAVVFGSQYVGLISAILTLLILVLSEIIPKTLGATYWQRLAPIMAAPILGLTRLLLPFVWLSEKITRLLAPSSVNAFTLSRDELQAMAEIGAEEGQIDEREVKIVSNLMRLRALSVRNIMTPRPVIFMVSQNMTVEEFFSQHAAKPFSRIPIYRASQDEITGYVLKNDLFLAQARDQFQRKLLEFERTFLTLPDFLSVSQIFDRLVREGGHIALLVDEYGAIQGLVTLEDVFETLIGLEITDESDIVENMQALAHKRWRERIAALGIDPESLDPSKLSR